MKADIKEWDPEDPKKWDKRLAWTTVWISTFSLTFGFCAWYLVPSLAPHLNAVGFHLDASQLYWLVAMVGLSAGTLRIVWTFLPPIMGTRKMASTNYYFPKSKRGFALGVQGGLSDFGTSLVQFVTPIVITFSVFGILGSPQHEVVAGQVKEIWLQNAGWIWVPLVVILSILAIVLLRSVPVTANFKTQMSIFKSKHTWFMTLFYYGTFATFAGLGAHFALMGDGVFNHIEGAPSAIAFAWVGPAIGALARVGAGKVSDKIRGGRVTTIMAAAVIIGLIFLCVYKPDSVMGCWIWMIAMWWVFFWTGCGNASTTQQMAVLFPPVQGGAVVGWTSAIGAYGPFTIGVLLASTSPLVMFAVSAVIFAAILVINVFFYDRKNAPNRC